MKQRPLIVLYVVAVLAVSTSALSIAGSPDAFRSDSTLRFMRHFHKPQEKHKPEEKQNPEEVAKDVEKSVKDLQRGPNYDKKKAQKASDKAAEKQKDTPKNADPLAEAGQAVVETGKDVGKTIEGVGKDFQDAGKDTGKAIAQGFKNTQKGPNWHKGDKGDKKNAKAKASKSQDDKEEVPAGPGCKNSKDAKGKAWTDAKGKDCEDYEEGEFCTRHGGYGDAWLDEWGTFEEAAKKGGKSAKQACCICGGGDRKKEKKDKSKKVIAAAPGPAAAAAPGVADAPAPAIAGPVLGTKAGRPLAEQGYTGELVKHEDGDTMTSDWGKEFGPKAGHRDFTTICKEHPDNSWCMLHGYNEQPRRSAATTVKCAFAVLGALFGACLW